MAFGSVFILLAAGLDDLFGWSPDLALGLDLISLTLIVIGDILGSYAFVENAFFWNCMPAARTWLDRYYKRSLRLGAEPRLLGQFDRQSRHAVVARFAFDFLGYGHFWVFLRPANPS